MSTNVPRGRLGDRLVERGLITGEKLEVALQEQRRAHRPLGRILASLGFVSQADIARCLAEDFGLEFLPASAVEPDPLVLSGLDPTFVRETLCFPYRLRDGVLLALMVEPDDPTKAAAVRKRFPYPLQAAVTTEADIALLIRKHLQVVTSQVAEILSSARAEGGAEGVPIEALVQALLTDGIHRQATDIHLEPEERVTRVRFRVDGLLQTGENLPLAATPAIVSRIKILAHLDISERRRPQDGRMRFNLEERELDLRVSVLPSNYGENVVLRVLEGSASLLRLEHLGVSRPHQTLLGRVSSRPHGLFLVTGPTGSGKTTTLYAMLAEIDAVHRKVATIEDPIEYRLPLLRQTQVDPAIGFGFGSGLRSLLRQDPDVILVGEIRDQETADMAIKASMTGHLVLSTLHTNSAVGSVPRLVDMGVEAYLVEDSLIGAMSQRLVRRVCASCAEDAPPSASEIAWLGAASIHLRRGSGCERCDGSGYQGRIAMVEIFLPDQEGADAMRRGASVAEIERLAAEGGFRTLEEDGKRLVREGITTMEEVFRVCRGHRLTREEREGLAA